MSAGSVMWMRHGTCADGLHRPTAHAQPDTPLATRGRVEVTRACQRLAANGWAPNTIVSSPLLRAADSAATAAAVLGCGPPRIERTLAEWAAPRCVLGRDPSRYPPEYLAWRRHRLTHPDSALPGGESLRCLHQRAQTGRARLADLAARHGPILVISHRVLIGAVAALATGVDDPAGLFTQACRFALPPAGCWAEPRW
jgi:probable phosphoglycerate mutase